MGPLIERKFEQEGDVELVRIHHRVDYISLTSACSSLGTRPRSSFIWRGTYARPRSGPC